MLHNENRPQTQRFRADAPRYSLAEDPSNPYGYP